MATGSAFRRLPNDDGQRRSDLRRQPLHWRDAGPSTAPRWVSPGGHVYGLIRVQWRRGCSPARGATPGPGLPSLDAAADLVAFAVQTETERTEYLMSATA